MSAADIPIVSELTLMRDQFQQELAQQEQELRQWSQRLAAQPINLPVKIDQAALTQQLAQLQQQLAAQPLSIPVQFVPQGGVPGMPAAPGMPGMPAAAPAALAAPAAAGVTNAPPSVAASGAALSAVNLGNLGNVNQQWFAAAVANSYPQPFESGFNNLGAMGQGMFAGRGQGGGVGGGYGGIFNPFSVRGFGRAVGNVAAVYAAESAMRLGAGLIEAEQTEAHPEDVLRRYQQVGGVHDVLHDPVMRQQSQEIASARAGMERMRAAESIPIAGAAMRLLFSATGGQRVEEKRVQEAELSMRAHESALDLRDRQQVEAAQFRGDRVGVARIEAAQANRRAYTLYEQAGTGIGGVEYQDFLRQGILNRQNVERAQAQAQARDYAGAIMLQAGGVEEGIFGLQGNLARATGEARIGIQRNIAEQRGEQERLRIDAEFEQKMAGQPQWRKDQLEREERQAQATRAARTGAEQAGIDVEADVLGRQRSFETFQSGAFGRQAAAVTQEMQLRAAGQGQQAGLLSARESIREEVQLLEARARLERDSVQANELLSRSKALQAQEAGRINALITEQARQNVQAAGRVGLQADVLGLRAQGRNYEAELAGLYGGANAELELEKRPGVREEIFRRTDAQRDLLERQHTRSIQDVQAEARDIDLRMQGRGREADVKALERRINQELADNAGDPAMQNAIAQRGTAEMQQLLRGQLITADTRRGQYMDLLRRVPNAQDRAGEIGREDIDKWRQPGHGVPRLPHDGADAAHQATAQERQRQEEDRLRRQMEENAKKLNDAGDKLLLFGDKVQNAQAIAVVG